MLDIATQLARAIESVIDPAYLRPINSDCQAPTTWGSSTDPISPTARGAPHQPISLLDVNLRNTNRRGPYPRVITCALSQKERPSDDTVTNQQVIVRAILDYGSGGTSQRTIIDWKRGTQFQVVADWLRVSVDYSNDGTDPSRAVNTTQCVFYAMAGIGGRLASGGSVNSVTFTHTFYDLVTNVYSEIIAIPEKAYQLQVITNDVALQTEVNFQQSGVTGSVRGMGEFLSGATGFPTNSISIPQGARFLRLRNRNAGTITVAQAVFSIGL